MVVAFMAHLMQPLSRLLVPLPDDSTSDNPPSVDSQDLIIPRHPILDLSASNPWMRASFSTALDWVRLDSAQASSQPIAAQLPASLHGSARAFGAMCESSPQMAALFGIPEELIVNKQRRLMQPTEASVSLSAENKELKKKLHDMSIKFSRCLDSGVDRWRAKVVKAKRLADAARFEMKGLNQLLADERRANSDLVLALEALRSSGHDTSVVEAFLIESEGVE